MVRIVVVVVVSLHPRSLPEHVVAMGPVLVVPVVVVVIVLRLVGCGCLVLLRLLLLLVACCVHLLFVGIVVGLVVLVCCSMCSVRHRLGVIGLVGSLVVVVVVSVVVGLRRRLLFVVVVVAIWVMVVMVVL